jgi:hypothetical protein
MTSETGGLGRALRSLWRSARAGAAWGAAMLIALHLARLVLGWPTYILAEAESPWNAAPLRWLPGDPSWLIFQGGALCGIALGLMNLLLAALMGLASGAGAWCLTRWPRFLRILCVPVTVAACAAALARGVTYAPLDPEVYRESGEWRTWADDYLRLRIPGGWGIRPEGEYYGAVSAALNPDARGWTYSVVDGDGNDVVSIAFGYGGPEFPVCLCAPLERYAYGRIEGRKMWVHRAGGGFTVKMANRLYRLDIHPKGHAAGPGLIQHVVLSCRFVEPGNGAP